MNTNNLITELGELFEKHENLRKELIHSQESHIEAFKKCGLTATQGLKDWQETLARILENQQDVVRQIKAITLSKIQ